MLKRTALFLALVVVALTLCGLLFGCDQVQSGTVYRKQYNPPYTTYDSQCLSRDKNYNCTFSMPVRHDWPAVYELCIRADDNPENKKVKTQCVQVDPATYDRAKRGDHWERGA